MSLITVAEVGPRRRALWSSDHVNEVEALMRALASGPRLDRVGQVLREHLETGGKRLRARLALGAMEAFGGSRADVVGWAAACELLHNASLVHDDLQDGDRMRRGRPATWAKHGAAQAINAGDLGLMLAYLAIREVPGGGALRWELAECLARHATQVVRGQADELDLLPMRRLSWPAYIRSVQGKTAALFALPVAGAALTAGLRSSESRALANAFEPIGALYQIQDDVLDLFGDKGRDCVGSDIAEGKVSALVVEHLRLHPDDEVPLVNLLSTRREDTSAEDIALTTASFRDGGALDAVWGRLRDIEDGVVHSEVLASHPRLHAVAVELVAQAISPIAHTAPGFRR